MKLKLNLSFDNFDKLNYKKLIPRNNSVVSPSEDDIINYLLSCFNKDFNNKITSENLKREYQNIKNENYPKEYICNGHNAMKVLSLLTNGIISNDNPIKYDKEILTNNLILAYNIYSEKKDILT